MQRQERHCITCKVVKPFSEFHKNKRTKEGVHNKCKLCQNEVSRIRYKKEGTKLRQQMAEQRLREYDKRLSIERASRAKRKEIQRPLKNARQQIRNRLLSENKFLLRRKDIDRLYRQPCFRCGTKVGLSIDHIIPLARGGNHSLGNLMTLCRPCNSSKGKKLLVEWLKDSLVNRGG